MGWARGAPRVRGARRTRALILNSVRKRLFSLSPPPSAPPRTLRALDRPPYQSAHRYRRCPCLLRARAPLEYYARPAPHLTLVSISTCGTTPSPKTSPPVLAFWLLSRRQTLWYTSSPFYHHAADVLRRTVPNRERYGGSRRSSTLHCCLAAIKMTEKTTATSRTAAVLATANPMTTTTGRTTTRTHLGGQTGGSHAAVEVCVTTL